MNNSLSHIVSVRVKIFEIVSFFQYKDSIFFQNTWISMENPKFITKTFGNNMIKN